MGRCIDFRTNEPLTQSQYQTIRNLFSKTQNYGWNCGNLSMQSIVPGQPISSFIKVSFIEQGWDDEDVNPIITGAMQSAKMNSLLQPEKAKSLGVHVDDNVSQETSYGDRDAMLILDTLKEVSLRHPEMKIYVKDDGIVPLCGIPRILQNGEFDVDVEKLKESWVYWLKSKEDSCWQKYFERHINKTRKHLIRISGIERADGIIGSIEKEYEQGKNYYAHEDTIRSLNLAFSLDTARIHVCLICHTPTFCDVSAHGSYSCAGINMHSHLQKNHGCYPYYGMRNSKGKAWATFPPDNVIPHVKGKIEFPYMQLAREIYALVQNRHINNYPEVKKLKGYIDLAGSIAK